MVRKPTEILTGIEIGTSAIKVCAGQPLGDGSISIIGFDETPCVNKVVKGEVQDVEFRKAHKGFRPAGTVQVFFVK